MKGGTSTKLVMAAALVTALSLTIVLLLVLVLLAQLYCSLLLRKRRLTTSTNTTTSALPLQSDLPLASPLGSVYAQGVLHAPRSFLFPAIINKQEGEEDLYKQRKQQQQQLSSMTAQESKGSSPHGIGIISSTFPSPSFMSVPPIHQEAQLEASSNGSTSGGREHMVYISNPIYEQPSKGDDSSSSSAAFETPDSSPSHLEMGGNEVEEEEEEEEEEIINVEPSSPLPSANTPPLTPMKKLSGQLVVGAACSLSLREVGTSGSCSGLSSSSSGSPCTSPSW